MRSPSDSNMFGIGCPPASFVPDGPPTLREGKLKIKKRKKKKISPSRNTMPLEQKELLLQCLEYGWGGV